MPTDLFYNTGIATYIWILSKDKRPERKGKIQLIDATKICHELNKPLGAKKNEFYPEDREKITKLYSDFKETKNVKIFDSTEFLYKEYTVMQPFQRSYSITEDSIQTMLQTGSLSGLYDEAKVMELEEKGVAITAKEQNKLDTFNSNKSTYEAILNALNNSVSNEKWMSPDDFMPVLTDVLKEVTDDKKILAKIAEGLSVMDKNAVIQREAKGKNKGEIIYDKTTRDTEIVRYNENIDDYMAREVLPHIPDAKWFWEENLTAKKPVIKIGAEIPFTKYFYEYQPPKASEELMKEFINIESSVSERIKRLFGGI